MLSPEEWLVAIDNGLEYRRKFGLEDSWNKLEMDYLNDPESDTAAGPNLIYSMGDSLMSSLTVPDPEFVLTAEHPSAVDRQPIVEAVDNWLIRKLKMKRSIDRAILHNYLFGKSILKIGYDSEFGWSPYYDIGDMNNLMGMTMTQFDKKGNRIESMDTQPGMPWVRPVLPHDIVVPWGTIYLDDAPWIAHRVIRRNDSLKKDPKYKNTTRLEPQISMESFMQSYSHVAKRKVTERYRSSRAHSDNTELAYNELWEIHDRMTGKIFVVSPDYGKFLRDDYDALQVAGLPFVESSFVLHPRAFWSTPQAYYLGQIQKTQYDIAVQAAKQRRISCLKFIASKNAMSRDELNKLISGDVGAVGLADTAQPIRDIFVPFPQGSSFDFMLQSDANRRDARDMIGFSRNQLGEFDSSSRRTAREATFVQSGSQLRTSKRMSAIVDLYIDSITKINKIIFKFWTVPRFMLVDSKWTRFTGDEIQGDYLYDVSLATKRNISRAQRKVEALMLMAQFAQIGLASPQLLQYVTDAANDPGFEKILQPFIGKGAGQPAAQNALPTIPATKTEGNK